MRMIDAAAVEGALGYPFLVDVLGDAFRTGAISPLRHHHTIELSGRPDATLLLMPAWQKSAPDAMTAGPYAGVKLVTVFPDNGERFQRPAIYGVYLLLSTDTGEPLALIDAPKLTVWRTAAASALAARDLARTDASRMLMVGAGALAPYLVRAHASVRPIREVAIWNRSRAAAERVAGKLANLDLTISVLDDLETGVRNSDIISTATISADPLIRGAWLQPGQHLDCVGAFRPDMRETDDDCVRRARLWVDTLVGGKSEAGDVVMPLKAGIISEADIQGDLFSLASGDARKRQTDTEITMFKSVGASIEDLAAAVAIYERTS
jgi:ornithine cyclodeaminase/alanine dehydrogenase-like protein (mu-crystallin family)